MRRNVFKRGPVRARRRLFKRRFVRKRPMRAKYFRRNYIPRNGFGNSHITKLRYVEEITMNPGAGLIANYVFSANGLYDPNVTGTGHQPRAFDQLMTFFDHYVVLGAKITVTPVKLDTANTVPGYFGILVSDDGITVAGHTLLDIMETRLNKSNRTKLVGFNYDMAKTSRSISAKFSARKFFHKNVKGDDIFRGSASSNPSEQAYFEIYHSSVNGNDPDPCTFFVQIEYIALFTERKIIPVS